MAGMAIQMTEEEDKGGVAPATAFPPPDERPPEGRLSRLGNQMPLTTVASYRPWTPLDKPKSTKLSLCSTLIYTVSCVLSRLRFAGRASPLLPSHLS